MHQVIRILIVICICIFINSNTQECPEHLQIFTKLNTNIENTKIYNVKGTVYHAKNRQTDSTPLETASMKIIDTVKLKRGTIKWVAISRDLHIRWGGTFKYGDTLEVFCKREPRLNGSWLINDVMHKRWKLKIDFLQHHKSSIFGKYSHIKIEHRPRKRSHKYLKISSEFSRNTKYKKNI